MRALEEKILSEGTVLPGNILKVGSFLNHRIDIDFLFEIGHEICRLFSDAEITDILTIETSGIPIAVACASEMHVPVVFAKKSMTGNLSGDMYSARIHSFTHGNDYDAVVSCDYIRSGDKVLVVDDFLANGEALEGLFGIIKQAGAEVVGACCAIEKGFQGGGDRLRKKGYRIESLAIIDSMSDGSILFRH